MVDILDGYEPLEPGLALGIMEDLLAFGVAVLDKSGSGLGPDVGGAPERQILGPSLPPDDADQICVYPGMFTTFPDFARADKKHCVIAPKLALRLRWTRCLTGPQRGEPVGVQATHDNTALLVEDGWRMWQSAVRCWSKDRLFARYSIGCEHVALQKLEPLPVMADVGGWEFSIEVELNAAQVRPGLT